ncbi:MULTISPECIES: RNase P modulator RnpM [Bacillaceae]|uniref:YlxR family protein n=1 Tax=Evansella alkalicola TaxID=745819 RepID=A0ABS6JT79_9BACI|nr:MULTISPECIES: YlxR family protein [Bacillaceae]MBU9720360.1 YlxR family protein [Bacillus alkalicola]
MAGKKKTPLRKCIMTNEMKPKKELIRVVRTPEKEIVIDHTSKKSGRGAYISSNEEVILEAKKKNAFSRHLKMDVPEYIYEQLLEEVAKGKI